MKKSFKCNCGGKIEESKTIIEGFGVSALICNKCGDAGISPEAAKEFLRFRESAENKRIS